MMSKHTRNFFKTTTIFIFCVSSIMWILNRVLSNPYYNEVHSTTEICIWLVFPFFVVMISLFFAKIIMSISKSGETKLNDSNDLGETNFNKTIWKNLFYFSLLNTLILFLTPIVHFVIHGKFSITIHQSFEKLNGFDYLVICVLSGYFLGLLYSIATKKKKSYLLLVIFLFLEILFMTYYSFETIRSYEDQRDTRSVFDEGDYHEYRETQLESLTGEITYATSDYERSQDSLEALQYNFNFEDLSSLETGAYFADLWESPLHDKDSAQAVLINFLDDYLKLRKYGYVAHFLDAPRYQDLTKQSLKVWDKIERDPIKLLSAFKSYKAMFYYLIPNEIYVESGLRNLTKLLLQTHYELYDDHTKLDKIYTIMTRPRHDKEYLTRYDYFNDLKGFISKNVLTTLQSKANFYSNNPKKNTYYGEGEAVWLYSFWARRHKEKNDDEVFQILYEIDNHYQ